MAPGEEVHIDYFEFMSLDYLVVKDKASGFITCKKTKNKKTEEATRVLHTWIHQYGLPHTIKSDGAKCFGSGFTSWLKGYGINHIHSS